MDATTTPVSERYRQCQLAALFKANGEAIVLKQGEAVAQEWTAHNLLFVKDGWLMRSHLFENGRQSTTGLYIPNDVFNFENLLGYPMHGEVDALTDAELLALPSDEVSQALYTDPGVARSLFWRQAADAHWLREALQSVGQLGVEDRLIVFIAQTRQRLIDYAGLEPDSTEFSLPLTQGQLGAIIGSTIIHTNRVVRQLREKNLLIIKGQTVRFLNLDKFEEHAERLTA